MRPPAYRRARGRRLAATWAVVAMVALLAGWAPGRPAAAQVAQPSCLVPKMFEANVSQGMPHNGTETSTVSGVTSATTTARPPLVQGKTALVKLYLGLSSLCSSTYGSPSIQMNAAATTLKITDLAGSALTTCPSNPFGPTATSVVGGSSAYSNTSEQTSGDPGDLVFQVPGCMLAPTADASGTTLTFTVTYAYTAKATVSGTVNTWTGTSTFSSQAPLAQVSKPLRLLLIPLGDSTQPVCSQFTFNPTDPNNPCLNQPGTPTGQKSSAQQAVEAAIQDLDRVDPVPDGVAQLTDSQSLIGAGVRYHLASLSSMIDLRSVGILPGSDGKFCINGTDFKGGPNWPTQSSLAEKLDAGLAQWNAAQSNAYAVADRVVGVIDSNISDGSGSCMEGVADIGSTHAEIRALHDLSSTAGDYQLNTGPVLDMESAHTWGEVGEQARWGTSYHSSLTYADQTVDYGRGLNLLQPGNPVMANPTTVMNSEIPSLNGGGLMEQQDWADTLCALGGPASAPAGACPGSGTVVGTQASAFGQTAPTMLVASGQIDVTNPGTSGTDITDSYYAPHSGTPDDSTSIYRVVQRDSSGRMLANNGFDVSIVTSEHNGSASTPSSPCPNLIDVCGTFNFAYPASSAAASFQLWKVPTAGATASTDPATVTGATLLATRSKGTTPPVVTSVNTTNVSGTPVNLTNDTTGDDTQPAISADGTLMAWTRHPTGLSCTEIMAAPLTSTGQLGSIYHLSAGANTFDPSMPGAVVGQNNCFSSLVGEPSWRPDNQVLAYTDGGGTGGNLYVVAFTPPGGTGTPGFGTSPQQIISCLSVGNLATAGCISNPTPLSGNRYPGWSAEAWPANNTAGPGGAPAPAGWRLSFDAMSTTGGSSNLYMVDTDSGTVSVPVNGQNLNLFTAELLTSNARDGSWSHPTSDGITPDKLLSYTNLATSGIYQVDAGHPQGTGTPTSPLTFPTQALYPNSTQAAWGNRFITSVIPGANGTSSIAVADYASFNSSLHPTPVAKTSGSADINPTITALGPAGGMNAFTQYIGFARPTGTTGATHDIFLMGMTTTDHRDVIVTGYVDPANIAYARATILLDCVLYHEPAAWSLRPTYSDPATGAVTFEASLAHTANTCGNGAGVPLVEARIDDGFSDSGIVQGGPLGTTAKPPQPTIVYPQVGTIPQAPGRVLTLVGLASDPQDGELTGSSLTWTLTANGSPYPCSSCTGTYVNLTPPSGGFPSGNWVATLKAVDSQGLSSITTMPFTVALPVQSANVDVDPDKFTIANSTPGSFMTLSVAVPGHDLTAVDPSTVALTHVSDANGNSYDLPTPIVAQAGTWQISNPCVEGELGNVQCGQAKFDRNALAQFLLSKSMYNEVVYLWLSGSTSNPGDASGYAFSGYNTSVPYVGLS